jgi:hypothetical protein
MIIVKLSTMWYYLNSNDKQPTRQAPLPKGGCHDNVVTGGYKKEWTDFHGAQTQFKINRHRKDITQKYE